MEFDVAALLGIFVTESEERISAMEEAVLALEERPSDTATAEHLLRIAHTLKGDAGILDLPPIVRLAHVLEDLLSRVGAGTLEATSALGALLLESVDVLRAMVAAAAKGELDRQLGLAHEALVERLAAFAASSDSEATPAGTGAAEPSRWDGAPADSVGGSHTLRIETSKLDRMLNLSGEIAVARGRLGEVLAQLDARGEALDLHRQLDTLFGDLQELVMKARMVPIRPTLQRYARLVHDAANTAGKLAQLVVDDGDVEVDSTIVERLRGPLTHLIRNAIDHGIEAPDERVRRGKGARGKIVLRARYDSGGIVVQVEDDGRGFDEEAIVARAKRQGLIDGGDILSGSAIHALVFESGLSTAATVTELSGRGVGMDIVKRDVEAVRGVIDVETHEGAGTTISLRLPLTVALVDGLVVGVEAERYIVPIDSVIECIELVDARSTEPRGVVQRRGRALPYLRLRHAMGLGNGSRGREHVVVVRHGTETAGLVVDALCGESQTVIKPLGPAFRRIPGISGSSILSSGRVALILDVAGLLERDQHDRTGVALVGPSAP